MDTNTTLSAPALWTSRILFALSVLFLVFDVTMTPERPDDGWWLSGAGESLLFSGRN